jgi:hypothetical protein
MECGTTLSSEVANLAEGDTDPLLKKKVATHILSSDTFVVYLDEDSFVQWHGNESAPGASGVFNRVSHLETLSMVLKGTEQLQPCRRLLGESVARLFSDHNDIAALNILDNAASYIEARSTEHARSWFLKSGAGVTILVCLPAIVAWLFRLQLTPLIGRTSLELMLGGAAGACGALLAILTRTDAIRVDAYAGPAIHRLEAMVRIGAGALAGVIGILAVKANVIAGFVNQSEHNLALTLILAVTAGISERFVPSLLAHQERNALGNGHERAESSNDSKEAK